MQLHPLFYDLHYGLLDRDWPEEVELEDAAGPIAKKLMRQE